MYGFHCLGPSSIKSKQRAVSCERHFPQETFPNSIKISFEALLKSVKPESQAPRPSDSARSGCPKRVARCLGLKAKARIQGLGDGV